MKRKIKILLIASRYKKIYHRYFQTAKLKRKKTTLLALGKLNLIQEEFESRFWFLQSENVLRFVTPSFPREESATNQKSFFVRTYSFSSHPPPQKNMDSYYALYVEVSVEYTVRN